MRATRWFIFVFLFCTHLISKAQTPNWSWVKSEGNSFNNAQNGYINIASDPNGNIILAGNFTGDSISFGATTLYNNGASDFFIVKYDTNGNVIWAISEGGMYYDIVHDLAVDSLGNIIIIGDFLSSTINFDSTILVNPDTLTEDIFIAKYNSNGNLLWVEGGSGSGNDLVGEVSLDPNGNIFIAGIFRSPTLTFGNMTLTRSNMDDMFVVKFDPSGNSIWSYNTGGFFSGNGAGVILSCDIYGNSYVAGGFYSPDLTFGNNVLNNQGGIDAYLVKFSANGSILWAKSEGGFDDEHYSSSTTDLNGNVILSGGFYGMSTVIGGYNLINASNDVDLFIVKYDSSGNSIWAKREGGIAGDYASDILADNNGNIFLTGWFGNSITLGLSTFIDSGLGDIFIVKYNANSNLIWAKSAGGNYEETACSIAIDSIQNVFITGTFASTVCNFDAITLNNSGGPFNTDIFIGKLNGSQVGVDQSIFNSNVTIAPNPLLSQSKVSFNELQRNVSVKLYDIIGNEIRSFIFSGSEFILEKGTLDAGIYFMEISDENKNTTTKKIIVN